MLSKEKNTVTFLPGKQTAILIQYPVVTDLKPYVGGYRTEKHCIVTNLNINYYLMFSEVLSLVTWLTVF